MASFSIQLKNVNLRFQKNGYQRGLKERFSQVFSKKPAQPNLYTRVCQDLSFTIMPGERIGLIGNNGEGKSSLLRLIQGVLKPDSGSVQTNGRIGAILELSNCLLPDHPAAENIVMHALLNGCTSKEAWQMVPKVLEASELEEFASLPVKHYSSGMAARLSFMIATQMKPEILLLDEVFAVGDGRFHQKAESRMHDLINRSQTMVLCSHQLDLITRFCDRVFWLKGGKIVQEGSPASVCSAYQATF